MGLRTLLTRKIVSGVLGNQKTRRAVMDMLLEQDIKFFRHLADHAIVYFPNDAIGRSLSEHGEFARQSVRDLHAILEERGAYKTGMTILEVGANIGTHTIYLFQDVRCSTVIAIEPDPDNLSLLHQNIILNGLAENVTTLAVAASDHTGTAEFTRDLFNRGGSRLGAKRTVGKSRESFSVDVVRIDDLLKRETVSEEEIGLVWMDVEGHELAALKGMTRLISKYKPPIFFEYTPNGQMSGQQELGDLLYGNYKDVYVHSNGFRPLSRDEFATITKQVDLLVI